MNYELAKKLKDAGFPQKPEPAIQQQIGAMFTESCYLPPLSELIKACGDAFDSLGRGRPFNEEWYAFSEGEATVCKTASGETPEIAVANLWLSLRSPSLPT